MGLKNPMDSFCWAKTDIGAVSGTGRWVSECMDGGGEGKLSRAKCVFHKIRETGIYLFIYLFVCMTVQ